MDNLLNDDLHQLVGECDSHADCETGQLSLPHLRSNDA